MAQPIPPELTDADIDRLTLEAFRQLIAAIQAGEAPQTALQRIQEQWSSDYSAMLSERLSEVLQRTVGSAEMREWPIGDLTLSQRLHQQAAAMAIAVRQTIAEHAKGYHDARALILKIFEGYDFRDSEPWAVANALPKYLKRLTLEERSAINLQLARAYASQLKTGALKAAYMEAIDKIEAGAGQDAIVKKLRTAWMEKNRYFASRIARTELHRAYTDQQAREIMGEEQLEWVQVRLSSKHPKPDICNLHASVDKYGLGAGVYLKGKAPKPPYHPHCLCLLSPRYDLTGRTGRERPTAERQWLLSQPTEMQVGVMGSYDRAQAVQQDAKVDPLTLYDADKAVKLVRVGEL